MAYVKVKEAIIESLSAIDKRVLCAIYWHRCLTAPLAYTYFYSKKYKKPQYAARKFAAMQAWGLIEPVEYTAEDPAFFLTTLGIKTVQFLMGISDVDQERLMKKSKDIKMHPQNINHQMHLTEFALMFMDRAGKTIPYEYKDEKFMDRYVSIRPDGLIELEKYSIFLEMDMGTEATVDLMKKWVNYREFLTSGKFYNQKKPIVVLFILQNVRNVELRRKTVLKSIGKALLDCMGPKFDIYIDAPEQLLQTLFDKYILEDGAYNDHMHEIRGALRSHGFSLSSGDVAKSFTSGTTYPFYARKLNPQKKIVSQDGQPQEYFIDTFFLRPASVLRNAFHHCGCLSEMKMKLGRKIPLVIFVPDEEILISDLKVLGELFTEDTFFVSLKRLSNNCFYEALFQIDKAGNLSHFSDYSLKQREFERKIS